MTRDEKVKLTYDGASRIFTAHLGQLFKDLGKTPHSQDDVIKKLDAAMEASINRAFTMLSRIQNELD